MSVTFREQIKVWLPWYLTGPWAGRLIEAVGMGLDIAAERALEGQRASNVLKCEPDVLPTHARDRQIRLYDTEPIASKRYRLSIWHQLHRRRGTHLGEMMNVQPFFLPGTLPRIRIVHQDGAGTSATWWTMNPDRTVERHVASPSNWDWDGATTKWSRYWMVLYTDTLSTSADTWDGGGEWDGGPIWDGPLSRAQMDDIVAANQEAKAAHSILWGLLLVSDGAALDPTATATTNADGSTTLPTGNWWTSIDPTSGQPTRPSSVSVVYNLGQG